MNQLLTSQFREFNRLYKEENEIYHEIAVRLGLSDSAFSILYFLCFLGDGCTQKDICGSVFLSKQTVNSSIQKLEGLGYLYKEKGRGRDTHIFLTESGTSMIHEKIQPIIEMERRAFSALGEDAETLVRLSQRYLASLRAETQSLK